MTREIKVKSNNAIMKKKNRQVIINLFNLLIFLTLLISSCSKKKVELDPNVFYTCSMDPQVMEKKPGKCPICKMELSKTVVSPNSKDNSIKLSDTQIQLANIKTEEVKFGIMGEGLSLRGTVVPDKRKENIISSRVPGRIDKLYFKNEGEQIKAGEKVYEIYSEELQAAIRQYLLLKEKAAQLNGGNVNYKEMMMSARDKLLVFGLSENQVSQFTNANSSSLIPFYSNRSGVVDEVMISEGAYVNEGSSILGISDYSSVWVEAEAYPSDLTFISSGAKVKVIIEAFPNEVIEGKVSFENPELEQQSKFTLVRIDIINKNGKIKPGMRATVTLLTKEVKSLIISESAVLYEPKMNTVWIKNKEGGFIPKMVETGIKNNGQVEIKSGLEAGEQVVVSGAYLLNSEYLLRKGSSSMADMAMP
jgi:Cu(I)/Ag(I) efflux system membrane fusion protein